ncbi:hypothetical protein, partial [Enterobacter intestinihominis]
AWSAPGAYCGSGGGVRASITTFARAPQKKHPTPKRAFFPKITPPYRKPATFYGRYSAPPLISNIKKYQPTTKQQIYLIPSF